MKKDPQDRIKSLKNARVALDKKHSRHSNDDSPTYLTFKNPDNWFHIDYPVHVLQTGWKPTNPCSSGCFHRYGFIETMN